MFYEVRVFSEENYKDMHLATPYRFTFEEEDDLPLDDLLIYATECLIDKINEGNIFENWHCAEVYELVKEGDNVGIIYAPYSIPQYPSDMILIYDNESNLVTEFP